MALYLLSGVALLSGGILVLALCPKGDVRAALKIPFLTFVIEAKDRKTTGIDS